MHFADGDPPGDALERALREEIDGWRPRRPPSWVEFAARAGSRPRSRRWGVVAGAAALAAIVAFALGLGLAGAHDLPAGIEQVRDRLLP